MSKQYTQGFTLVETLVAILLLTLSISGPLYVAQQSFTSAKIARDQTVARFLAQEGVELVRAYRDTNTLSSRDWLNGLETCKTQYGCYMHHTNNGLELVGACSESGCPALNYNRIDSAYSYDSGSNYTPSNYTRTIIIEDIETDKDTQVTVEVFWNDRGVERSVRTQEYLFNWL